eukprot:gene9944-7815_t
MQTPGGTLGTTVAGRTQKRPRTTQSCLETCDDSGRRFGDYSGRPHSETSKDCEFTSQGLSNILWACVKLELPKDSPLVQSILDRSLEVIDQPSVSQQSVTNTIWAAAKLGVTSPVVYAKFGRAILKHMHRLDAQGISNVLWAFATASIPPPKGMVNSAVNACLKLLEASVDARSMRKNGLYDTQPVSNMLWACAKLDYFGHKLYQTAISYLKRRSLEGMRAQEVIMVSWALARYHACTSESGNYVGKVDSSVRDELMRRLCQSTEQLTSSEIATASSTVAMFSHYDPNMVENILKACREQPPTPKQATNIAFMMAKLNVVDDEFNTQAYLLDGILASMEEVTDKQDSATKDIATRDSAKKYSGTGNGTRTNFGNNTGRDRPIIMESDESGSAEEWSVLQLATFSWSAAIMAPSNGRAQRLVLYRLSELYSKKLTQQLSQQLELSRQRLGQRSTLLSSADQLSQPQPQKPFSFLTAAKGSSESEYDYEEEAVSTPMSPRPSSPSLSLRVPPMALFHPDIAQNAQCSFSHIDLCMTFQGILALQELSDSPPKDICQVVSPELYAAAKSAWITARESVTSSHTQETAFQALRGVAESWLEWVTPDGMFSVDILVKYGGLDIALEIDGPWHFCINAQERALGETILRRSFLARRNLVVVSVPVARVSEHTTLQARQAYLKARLDLAVSANHKELLIKQRRRDIADMMTQQQKARTPRKKLLPPSSLRPGRASN